MTNPGQEPSGRIFLVRSSRWGRTDPGPKCGHAQFSHMTKFRHMRKCGSHAHIRPIFSYDEISSYEKMRLDAPTFSYDEMWSYEKIWVSSLQPSGAHFSHMTKFGHMTKIWPYDQSRPRARRQDVFGHTTNPGQEPSGSSSQLKPARPSSSRLDPAQASSEPARASPNQLEPAQASSNQLKPAASQLEPGGLRGHWPPGRVASGASCARGQ